MKKTVFKGSGVAIITPFIDGGAIDYPALERILNYQVENGTDAVIICGTTGEPSTLTDAEHRNAISFAVKTVAGRIPVIAGTGSNDTAYFLELSQYAAEAGADALLAVTPYYNKCSQAGLVKHFECVADRVDIPMILYNVPSRTGVNILPETCAELAKHPNIVAIKEASGNISQIMRTAYLCGDDLQIYSGNDDQIVPILSLGGIGVISVLANCLPRETHDICQYWFNGKLKESLALQMKFHPLIEALFCDVNPIPVKEAMKLLGWCDGSLRMPLTKISGKNEERLHVELANAMPEALIV
ncbi:MAG: 4-hydroxy-tetrahydrodipicolinate synthase [Clostridia bacterium]|nr:4-hydroxy-tetrahydrodipicolinate synthase [Clostridia bacterium]